MKANDRALKLVNEAKAELQQRRVEIADLIAEKDKLTKKVKLRTTLLIASTVLLASSLIYIFGR